MANEYGVLKDAIRVFISRSDSDKIFYRKYLLGAESAIMMATHRACSAVFTTTSLSTYISVSIRSQLEDSPAVLMRIPGGCTLVYLRLDE